MVSEMPSEPRSSMLSKLKGWAGLPTGPDGSVLKPIKPHADPGLARQDSFPGARDGCSKQRFYGSLWRTAPRLSGALDDGLAATVPPGCSHLEPLPRGKHLHHLQRSAPPPATWASSRWRTTSAAMQMASSAGGRCGAAQRLAGPGSI